jgi:hypothetical protein
VRQFRDREGICKLGEVDYQKLEGGIPYSSRVRNSISPYIILEKRISYG